MGGLSARVTGLNFYLGSTILTAGALGLSVQAQEASPDDTWALEEVIVTAQRREESLNKVPIAVTAFSGDMLEKTSVTELTDIAGLTPGLYLSSYSTLSPQIFIRGIGSNDDGITAEGAVGVYLDDIYVGRASSALFDLFDLERLEVLKGPQGTLYGRNTNGGAINIITRKPDNETTGAFKATYGNYDALQLQGFVSAPFIEDRLYGKVSVSLKKRDGWTTDSISGNKVNDEDSLSLRGQLRFTPTDMLDAIVSMDYSRDRTTSSYKEVVFGSFFGFAPAESPDRFEGAYDLPDAKTDRNILGLSAKVTLDTDAVIYTSITGYRTMDLEYTEDYDSTPLPLVGLETTQDTKQFTQELRAASNTDSPLQWIAGLFYLHDTGEAFDLIDLGELYVGFPDEVTNSDTLTNSYAAFGEASYRLSDK
ncbi:MAG: TonB-dependent receptor plug domain-containing protein [Kordiimonadaceae bacterium]|nr:TonB-dependent receptor plug domain-containing protein [Kordiimonadaceae bacterium]